MDRRTHLFTALLGGLATVAPAARAQAPSCAGDGTPAQFVPKRPADANAAERDIEKFAKCPYCGMDRRQFHHSRMLVQYSDDLPDATCSLHCTAISLSLNIDRAPKAIWVGDNAAAGEPKPLVEVDKASFLIGSRVPGVMTAQSKVAYGTPAAAQAAQAEHGGEIGNFDQALLAAYTSMSKDVTRIRGMRAMRRQKMQGHTSGQPG
jgi:nitrous oxide reductase accessory protein NosL